MMETQTQITTMEQCAERIIDLARQQLDTELPELQPAIYLLPSVADEATIAYGALWTDGDALFYSPKKIAEEYRQDKGAVSRCLLHIIIHGLLGHFESCAGKDWQMFWYASDLETTDFLLRYARRFLRLKGPCQTKWLLNAQRGGTAEQIYTAILESGIEQHRNYDLVLPLRVDVHRWNHACEPSPECVARWSETARLVAMNLRDAGRDDLAERLERD